MWRSMNAGNQDIEALAANIRSYLREHPNAADTAQGVAQWWVRGEAGDAWLGKVRSALEQLVREGSMASSTLRDGTVIYERNKHGHPSPP